ncbi:MAG: hypothetical protein CL521_02045 [Actinobacteria bacterium]|nr:hypothetical protein [Actinomycetota bacterium]
MTRSSIIQQTVTMGVVIALALQGCSNPSLISQGTILSDPVPVSNPITSEFNALLSDIDSPESAEKSIDYFIDYMDSRFKYSPPASDAPQTQSVPQDQLRQLFSDTELAQMAKIEYSLRQSDLSAQESQTLLSIEQVSTQLSHHPQNQMGDFSTEDLRKLQGQIRQSIPNLASPHSGDKMSPLEGMVLSWVAITHDDGSAPIQSIPAKKVDVDEFHSGTQVQSSIGPLLFAYGILYLVIQGGEWLKKKTNKNADGIPISINEIRKVKKGRRTVTEVRVRDLHQLASLEAEVANIEEKVFFDNRPLSTHDYHGIAQLPSRAGVDDRDPIWVAKRKKMHAFPWRDLQNNTQKGDIIFHRTPSLTSKVNSKVSSWTHAGMIYEPQSLTTLESFSPGVAIYNPKSQWNRKGAYAFSVRRIQSLSQYFIENAVESVKEKWARSFIPPITPVKMTYWPLVPIHDLSPSDFFKEWADKDSLSSMYCFKLIYHTFLPYGIDLDSNRTYFDFISYNSPLSKFVELDFNDQGELVENAFIGVTGDDIYYSTHLGEEIIGIGLDQLTADLE